MDIASLSIGMHQVSLENSVQISVMKMTMNNNEIVNEQMTQMLDNIATDDNLGRNIDVTI